MARTTNTASLLRVIDSLRSERERLQACVDEIDAVFGRLGGAGSGGRPRTAGNGKVPAASTGGRRGRRKHGSFAISGEESVFNFVKSQGKPNAAEVNQHWQKEGRGGKADNTLTKLVKDKRLKRVQIKGERGGRYQVA
jgi:hypothetical protein